MSFILFVSLEKTFSLINEITISSIGQADDAVLLSHSGESMQNLLDISLQFCEENNITNCAEKTKLQIILPQHLRPGPRNN